MRHFAFASLALCALAGAAPAQPDKPAPKVPFPAAPAEKAWEKLPPRKKPPLPEWARVLSASMPKTTAKMLELDYLHRVKNPLGARLAAKIRYAVAHELKCDYGMAVAAADRVRAEPLPVKATDGEGAALDFARQLTHAGSEITDEEF